MLDDPYVIGKLHGPRPPRWSARQRITLLLLALVAGSTVLGAKRDPGLTMIVWLAVGLIWATWESKMTRLKGFLATFASVTLLGAGLALAAYGISHCSAGGASFTADNQKLSDWCTARTSDPLYTASGYVIALLGILSVPAVRRLPRWPRFLKRIDLGAACALLVATVISLISLEGIVYSVASSPLIALWYLGTSCAAWVGFAEWIRKRWLWAAIAFFLSIGSPLGLFLVLNVPVSFALFVSSLVLAWKDRWSRKTRVARDRGR